MSLGMTQLKAAPFQEIELFGEGSGEFLEKSAYLLLSSLVEYRTDHLLDGGLCVKVKENPVKATFQNTAASDKGLSVELSARAVVLYSKEQIEMFITQS